MGDMSEKEVFSENQLFICWKCSKQFDLQFKKFINSDCFRIQIYLYICDLTVSVICGCFYSKQKGHK